MKQAGYEAKKRHLKQVREEWRKRLLAVRSGTPTPTTLPYGELIHEYAQAQEKITDFIQTATWAGPRV
jgi:hypothetical protein